MGDQVEIATPSTPWQWMNNATPVAPAAYAPYTPSTVDPVAQDATATAPTGFVIKKGSWSILELGFLTDELTLGQFEVRILGVSKMRDGKYVQSPLATLTCTSASGLSDLPDITEQTAVGETHTACQTIVKDTGSDSIVVNSTGYGLATVMLDPGAHEYIRIEWQDSTGSPTRKVNGVWRGF